MAECIFCKIVCGEIPSGKVYEDEWTFAFMAIYRYNPQFPAVTQPGNPSWIAGFSYADPDDRNPPPCPTQLYT